MFRTAILASAAAIGFAQGATAKVFEGLYVGVSAGYGSASADVSTYACSPVCTFGNQAIGSYDLDAAATFGLFGGYSGNIGGVVAGVEGDLTFGSLEGAGPNGIPDFHETSLDWSASVRARLGANLSKNVLAYATAGVAFAGTNHTLNEMTGFPVPALVPEFSYDNTLTGFTYGAGIEMALGSNFAARLEYRRTDFGETVTPATLGLFAGPVDDAVSLSSDTLSLGVSMYF
jgi:outer membrane autotransporter protein